MNYTPVFGWFYRNLNSRAPSWTGVEFLYNFLTRPSGVGPYASELGISALQAGDVIQLRFGDDDFAHSLIVVSEGKNTTDTVRVATHTYDSDNRVLDTYYYKGIRYLHIEGVRR